MPCSRECRWVAWEPTRRSPRQLFFLASEEAASITGTVLDVNGGLRMG